MEFKDRAVVYLDKINLRNVNTGEETYCPPTILWSREQLTMPKCLTRWRKPQYIGGLGHEGRPRRKKVRIVV